MHLKIRSLTALMLLGVLAATGNAFAESHPFAKAKYVIQVSEANPARWTLAMNNAQNLLNHYGPSNVAVNIVAYGPGLKMLLAKNKDAKRVASIAAEGVEFDACHNTMMHMARKLGHMPKINAAATVVPGGLIKIGELEGQGYAYIKP